MKIDAKDKGVKIMTLQECYAALGGGYEDVLGRLGSERLVRRFILKFLDDPSYGLLTEALENKNYEEAFRASHTIKGICQNLSFPQLLDSSSKLTEALRSGTAPSSDMLFSQVRADYTTAVEAIRQYRDSSAS